MPFPRSLSSTATAIVLCLGLAAIGLSQSAPAPTLTLVARDGRRSMPLAVTGDQELVALDDLASAFQLAVQESLGAITVSYKGQTIVLTPDQTLASVSGRLISLPAPPTRNGRRWLVPVEFISRALAPVYDVRLDLRKPSRLLIIGDMRVPRITVRYDALGSAARLTIDATPRANSTVSQENDRMTVKFDADALDVSTPLLAPQGLQSLVQAVRLADPTTLTVELGPRFGGFKASTSPIETTTRMTIELASAQTDTPAAISVPAPPAGGPVELPQSFGQPTSGIRTIAIDPGHGGDDDGAKSPNGVKEKDVTLSVARRAKAAIEARLGVRVLLTREDDKNVAIDERAAIANNNKADLFISLHANASWRSAAAGAAVFSAAFDADTAEAAAPDHVERVQAFGGGSRDIELVPWDLAQTRHLDRSAAFAELLEAQMRDHMPLAAHPNDKAPLRVLESANMPAILVELGYLTNPAQEKLLAGDAFQNAFVLALYEAVVRFRDAVAAGGGR